MPEGIEAGMRTARVVAALRGARATRRALPRIPEEWAPRSVAEAYAMQDRFAEEPGVAVVGHKVGCASGASQRLMRTDGPIAGRILADECFADGATLPASRFFGVSVEAEFAFLMGTALPPRPRPYAREEAVAAVSRLVPVVEICDTRLGEWRQLGIEQIVADNSFAGGFVRGTAHADWRGLELAEHEVSLSSTARSSAAAQGGW